jgi:hypothetical protein
MKEYKLSTTTIEQITQFLKSEFGFDWNGLNENAMLNQTDCFVFVNGNGQVPNEINAETGEVVSYLDGLHFDILTSKDLTIPEGITRHFPINPKHKFA